MSTFESKLYCISSQMEPNQRDQDIYSVKRTYRIYLSTKYDPSTEASVHARYILACTDKRPVPNVVMVQR